MSREMINSGIPWIGEIPKGWKTCQVKNIFTISRGRVIPITDMDASYQYPVYSSQTKDNGCMGYIPTFDYEGEALTWTTDGANAGTVFYRNGKFNCTNICGILQLKEKSSFINYMLYSVGHSAYNCRRADTNGYKIMSNEMAEILIAVPSLPEQQKIASFLDRKCDEIDEMIALQEKIVEELKAYKQSVITEAVTKGLNPDVPMKDSGIEWVDSIPLSWKVAKIKNVISLLTDYDANGSFADIASNVKVNLGVPYAWMVRATDLANQRYGLVDGNNYCDISTFNYLKKSVVHSGDVLIAKRGEIGKVYLVPNVDCPMTLAPNTYLLKLRQRVIDNRYFHYFLTSEMGRMQLVLNNKSTAIGAIYKDDVKSISILLPSLREQQDIANHLDTKCTEIDNLISIKLSKIDSLKEYKKSIIYEYVTGKKEVIE